MALRLDAHAVSILLRWHVDAGVDLALDDVPHDRFAQSARAPPSRSAVSTGLSDSGGARRAPGR